MSEQPRKDARALELARKVDPMAVLEYEAARVEMLACADAFGRAMTGLEVDALKWARGLRSQIARVAVRWARARAAVVEAAESCSVL